MEKRFNREDEVLRKLMKEGGVDRPSANFKDELMTKLERRKAPIPEFKPLIPAYAWFAIVAGFVLFGIGLFLVNTDLEINPNIDLGFINKFQAPSIDLSSSMQYAIALVALFFLEIPFLKRFLDRQYSFLK